MKTLNTIQKIAKAGKIFYKILFILAIIGSIGCLIGLVSFACIPQGLVVNGKTIYTLIEENSKISIPSICTAMGIGMIYCIGQIFLCKISEKYFKNELSAGTPFTFDGAKELIRLGIFTICIPLASTIAAGILYGIMTAVFQDIINIDLEISVSVGVGIMYIIAGLLCRLGAETAENKPN